ncbi:PfkB family carbohydrate kinase [Thalassospiraceae bacterium LMO-SO8]|nr:PfkB family carbohydrate kinase [Alphaproteobacteria bacterium LMO-S08]WND77047.1 PfkB family carbohydrate kinase [Thalassospiraceae bacterium LMO-SO8]
MTVPFAIVGGVYHERCAQPLWNAVYGSAGRAAHCVSSLVERPIHLYTYVADTLKEEVKHLAGETEAKLHAAPADFQISFDYLHPLSVPVIQPSPAAIAKHPSISVSAEVALRFGMLEGDAVVNAEIAVYDPQSAFEVAKFGDNGSRADRLAVVMNRKEARSMTGFEDPIFAAKHLLEECGAEVVIVKMGGDGALVMTVDQTERVPLYRTDRVWKLGSGDVFSATFAALWACKKMDALEAADLSSRATAAYCESRALPVPSVDALRKMECAPAQLGQGTIYLAGPFFDIGQRWLVEEARSLLSLFGARVFSPVHEVGPGPANVVAPEDIAGLEGADAVLAIANGLDAGTLFEIGYAVKMKKPVVVLAQNIKSEDLKMIEGSGCIVVDDFVTTIYRAIGELPAK